MNDNTQMYVQLFIVWNVLGQFSEVSGLILRLSPSHRLLGLTGKDCVTSLKEDCVEGQNARR